ncbi:MAG: hypothetical protein LQ352_007182 [Teloschistes flavicans]|nr:MAG: hypothetical protein LQ352_007182 [Teloschistes flavicans]
MVVMTSSTSATLQTPLTSLLGIRHPILLAGMAHTSTAPLASAVSSAGGLGVIGGLGYTPEQLRSMIHDLKASLPSTSLPFGVDLALPSLAPTARKTNHDYTKGKLEELVDVIVEEKAKLFVCAVGVPSKSVVDRLHAGGVVVMNMVGAVKHAIKAFEVGCDIVCAQGGEGGGHTGDVSGNILVPACVDVATTYRPAMLGGGEGLVVAAGGIWDGKGLAAALCQGAVGVWVGTRFVASEEAGCSQMHKKAVIESQWGDTVRTLAVTGRPLRVKKNEWVENWEKKPAKVKELTDSGVIPMEKDMEDGEDVDFPFLMGQVAAVIQEIKPAGLIVDEMVSEAVRILDSRQGYIKRERESRL